MAEKAPTLYEQSIEYSKRLDIQIDRNNDQAVKAGENAVRSAVSLNGGAVIASLTLIGALKDSIPALDQVSFIVGLSLYLIGVLSAAMTFASAWVVNAYAADALSSFTRIEQRPFIEDKPNTVIFQSTSRHYRRLTFLLLGFAFLCFLLASAFMGKAVLSLANAPVVCPAH